MCVPIVIPVFPIYAIILLAVIPFLICIGIIIYCLCKRRNKSAQVEDPNTYIPPAEVLFEESKQSL